MEVRGGASIRVNTVVRVRVISRAAFGTTLDAALAVVPFHYGTTLAVVPVVPRCKSAAQLTARPAQLAARLTLCRSATGQLLTRC